VAVWQLAAFVSAISEDHAHGSATIQAVICSGFNFSWILCRLDYRKALGSKQRLRETVDDRIGIEPF
jgi:hypothetical protein